MSERHPSHSAAGAAPAGDPAEAGDLSRSTLALHVTSTFLIYIGHAFAMMMTPLIAKLHFGATPWQSFLVTAAVPTFLSVSIFWNELLVRWSLRRYIALYCLVAVIPAAGYVFIQSYAHLLLIQILTATGLAGWSPLNGAVLKRFYPDAVRGRVFGLLNIPFMISAIGTVLFTGNWLSAEPEAFRRFAIPIVLLQFAGATILAVLLWRKGDAAPKERPQRSGILTPILSMNRVLRDDAIFRRYEAAFMTYGAGYMICEGLLPLYMTDVLGLNYDEAARSSHVALRVGLLLCAVPFGWLYDRIGPTRSCAAAFAIIAVYPIGLACSINEVWLAASSAVYGVGMAGVMQGWMLGPVALARNPREVTQYVAIHATLVGVRGVLFQALGMILLYLTGGFLISFLVASIAFLWAARQMSMIDLSARLGRFRSTETSAAGPAARLEKIDAGTPVGMAGQTEATTPE